MAMTIGTLAEAAGVSVPTVRYYERRGIIEEPPRTAAGYRQYDEGTVRRIRFVRQAQDLGFTLDEIEQFLSLRVDDPARAGVVEQAARVRLETVEAKIGELERLRRVLERLVRACEDRVTTSEFPVLAMLNEVPHEDSSPNSGTQSTAPARTGGDVERRDELTQMPWGV